MSEPLPISSVNQDRSDYDDASLLKQDHLPHRVEAIFLRVVASYFTCWMFGIIGLYFSIAAFRMAKANLDKIRQGQINSNGSKLLNLARRIAIFGIVINSFILVCFVGLILVALVVIIPQELKKW